MASHRLRHGRSWVPASAPPAQPGTLPEEAGPPAGAGGDQQAAMTADDASSFATLTAIAVRSPGGDDGRNPRPGIGCHPSNAGTWEGPGHPASHPGCLVRPAPVAGPADTAGRPRKTPPHDAGSAGHPARPGSRETWAGRHAGATGRRHFRAAGPALHEMEREVQRDARRSTCWCDCRCRCAAALHDREFFCARSIRRANC